ncbi:MAG TPA: hypothetical protein VJ440_11790 [Candidatus Brocadiaceae bacterium]|nr:hypothetical protein [Candidatus Brocadiaceae bacterium]
MCLHKAQEQVKAVDIFNTLYVANRFGSGYKPEPAVTGSNRQQAVTYDMIFHELMGAKECRPFA